jgi:predicted transcriptional regulator
MKKMQSYRIDAKTIKEINIIAQKTMRTKSNVIEVAVHEYLKKLIEQNDETA